ncbi:MAG: ABC transporter ATP-binding protein [Duncaniella sp.]|nr:ABC transporter ATP-binding protein [Duncaniella sp.]
MITARNLSYVYDNGAEAVVDSSFTVGPGLYLMLGENGAGKTTLLHILSGLLYPTNGTVTIDGDNVVNRNPATLGNLFFLSESMDIPADTVRQFAGLHSPFYKRYNPDAFSDNLTDFGLTGNEMMRTLSFGTRHKSVLAYVMALGVDNLFLDEPANGLDIQSRHRLRAMMARTMTDESTVIVSTHTVSDLEQLFDGVIIMHHGRVILCDKTENIARKLKFITTIERPDDVLYVEQEMGLYHAIAVNRDDDYTEVDFRLLYSSLFSTAAPFIISILNNPQL